MTVIDAEIPNDVQDRNSEAWKKLCEYVDLVHETQSDEFSPREYLGNQLFSEIYTLPESVGKLKKVRKLWLYGSRLKSIPPEIGGMESLEFFDPYTSYGLHWFPYELTKCKHLKESRISTRILYGNYKNRMAFPSLDQNPVRYRGGNVKCSVCGIEITYAETNQLWITLRIGTDDVPLLANLCSEECENNLPQPTKGYVQHPHKGGADLKQPSHDEWKKAVNARRALAELKPLSKDKTKERPKLFKLIGKLWEKEQ